MAVWQNKYIGVNGYARSGKRIKAVRKIVMHYTANAGASAENHYRYFGNLEGRYASAHFFIDSKDALCIIPLNEMAYHANDVQKRVNGVAYRGVAELKPNANELSIGIELCIEKDGSFHPETIKKAVAVAVELCKRYGLDPLTDIVRHYDVTAKNCPAPWVKNSSGFTAFKSSVKAGLNGGKYVAPVEDTTPLLRKGDKGSYVQKLQELLNAKGYKLATDGIFGAGTEDDVKDFQKKNGLGVDGIVGDATWAKLNYVAPKPVKVENPIGNLVITRSTLNIRRDADPNSLIVGTTVKGAKFPVYGYKNGMYRIATEGGKWVNDDYVDYTPVKVETEDEDTFFRVVVGSFKSRPEAEIRVKELADKKVDAFLLTFIKDGVTFYRVVAGSYKERANADEAVANLKKLGFESFLAVYEG